jgi:hypothetical protein
MYATVKSVRSRLTNFYHIFAPHKAERVDAIVESFIDRGSSAQALEELNQEVLLFIVMMEVVLERSVGGKGGLAPQKWEDQDFSVASLTSVLLPYLFFPPLPPPKCAYAYHHSRLARMWCIACQPQDLLDIRH